MFLAQSVRFPSALLFACLTVLLFTSVSVEPARAQDPGSAEAASGERVTVTNDTYGFDVRYPAEWSASQGTVADPFGEEGGSAGEEVGIAGQSAAPEGWNRIAMAGPGAPSELQIYAHEVPARPLSELIEVLRLRFEGNALDPVFEVEREASWSGYPAWKIVADIGIARQHYVGVRAGEQRYVFFCGVANTDATATDCQTTLDELVEFSLLEADADPVPRFPEDDALADARSEVQLREVLRAWMPEVLPGDLERTFFEIKEERGGLNASAIYPDEGGPKMMNVLLGGEGIDLTLQMFERQEEIMQVPYGEGTIYKMPPDNGTIVFHEGNVLVGFNGGFTLEEFRSLLDELDLEVLRELSAER